MYRENKTMKKKNIKEVGTLVTTKGGESWIVEGGVPPHKPSSTGRVWVSLLSNPKHNRDFFPTVFNLKWQEIA